MGTVAYLGFIYCSKEGAKRRRCPEGGVWWRGMKMTGSHQKPWDTDFTVQSRNEAYKNSARNELSKNSRSDQRGALASSPPEYATVCQHDFDYRHLTWHEYATAAGTFHVGRCF